MRVAIYGAGSLGTILGAYISKNGGTIELINRNKAHIEALKTKRGRDCRNCKFQSAGGCVYPRRDEWCI